VIFEFSFGEAVTGSRFSFSCDLYQWLNETERMRLSIGLSDLEVQRGRAAGS
jgi:hypothetical protein